MDVVGDDNKVTGLDGKTYSMTKEEFAEMFEKIAKKIREDYAPPRAAFIMVCTQDHGALRYQKRENGFNNAVAIGLFECWKQQFVGEIMYEPQDLDQ